MNKAATEFPIVKSNVKAYKKRAAIVVQLSTGVRVACDAELLGCEFVVSGYYHGQLRGLLGNGNNELYDDFILPNGKIVSTEAEFGNAYKMTGSCAPVKTVDHKHHKHDATCSKYFGEDSDFE